MKLSKRRLFKLIESLIKEETKLKGTPGDEGFIPGDDASKTVLSMVGRQAKERLKIARKDARSPEAIPYLEAFFAKFFDEVKKQNGDLPEQYPNKLGELVADMQALDSSSDMLGGLLIEFEGENFDRLELASRYASNSPLNRYAKKVAGTYVGLTRLRDSHSKTDSRETLVLLSKAFAMATRDDVAAGYATRIFGTPKGLPDNFDDLQEAAHSNPEGIVPSDLAGQTATQEIMRDINRRHKKARRNIMSDEGQASLISFFGKFFREVRKMGGPIPQDAKTSEGLAEFIDEIQDVDQTAFRKFQGKNYDRLAIGDQTDSGLSDFAQDIAAVYVGLARAMRRDMGFDNIDAIVLFLEAYDKVESGV